MFWHIIKLSSGHFDKELEKILQNLQFSKKVYWILKLNFVLQKNFIFIVAIKV